MLRLLIFGASGGTGRELVKQGLERGFRITAFVRNPSGFPFTSKNIAIFTGNILDAHAVATSIPGHDVVISALGIKASDAILKKNTIVSQGIHNIIHGMEQAKVKRLLFISSFGVTERMFFPEKLFIKTVLKNIFADIPKQERLIKNSRLDWTIVRPARLTNGQKTGSYNASADLNISLFSHVARADVADFLLKNVTTQSTFKGIITLRY